MTFEEFTATRQPVTDEIWAILQAEDVTEGLPREAFSLYGEEYVLHQRGDEYFPHAWWYRPAARATLAEAEAVLWEWRKEWV